jgi:hypothetical protein
MSVNPAVIAPIVLRIMLSVSYVLPARETFQVQAVLVLERR